MALEGMTPELLHTHSARFGIHSQIDAGVYVGQHRKRKGCEFAIGAAF